MPELSAPPRPTARVLNFHFVWSVYTINRGHAHVVDEQPGNRKATHAGDAQTTTNPPAHRREDTWATRSQATPSLPSSLQPTQPLPLGFVLTQAYVGGTDSRPPHACLHACGVPGELACLYCCHVIMSRLHGSFLQQRFRQCRCNTLVGQCNFPHSAHQSICSKPPQQPRSGHHYGRPL